MTARARLTFERLRHAHGFGPNRSVYADVHRTLERLAVSNEVRGPGARHGAALDGNPGNGKTTIASHFGRHYERRCRGRYPDELTADGHEYLPVVYVNVDALPTIKGLNHALLTFYGMGPPKRVSAREMTQLVLECARCCHTSLVVIDDIHLLELRREADRDANKSPQAARERSASDVRLRRRRPVARWVHARSAPRRAPPPRRSRSPPASTPRPAAALGAGLPARDRRAVRLDAFTHWHARRLCSLLLARMLTPLDWHAAVRYLDYPETFINDGYHTTIGKLRSVDRFDKLIQRVKQIANQHADERIDYKQRRARLADWSGIDRDTWPLMQPCPGRNRWRADTPSRRARASVWLWCQVTSGHERAASIALPTSNLAHQGEFIRDELSDLRERLLILGPLLLATPADARQTIPAQLEAALHERGYVILRHPSDRRHRGEAHERRERPKPPRVPSTVADRVLAHVAAHTGVDIPTLTTTPFPGMQTPPAVIHARLLAAALLQRAAPTSWNAIAETINAHSIKIAEEQRAYQAARERLPRLADELEQLQQAIENPQTPAPAAPTTPHQERMRQVAETIQTRAAELLTASHGVHIARRASITACRQHTDLTCATIAAIHHIPSAQPAFSRATVVHYRKSDPDFDHRYQQLLEHVDQARHAAGFANANLRRGLAAKP